MEKNNFARPKYIEPFILKPLEIPKTPVFKPVKKEEPLVLHQYPTRSAMHAIPQRPATRSDVCVYNEYRRRTGQNELLKTMQGYVKDESGVSKGKTEIGSSRERTLRTLAQFALCPTDTPKQVEDRPSGRHEERKWESEVKKQVNNSVEVNYSVTPNPSLTPVICYNRKERVDGASKGTEDRQAKCRSALNQCAVSAVPRSSSIAPVGTPACKLTSTHDRAHITVVQKKSGGHIVALDTKTPLPDISVLIEEAEKLVERQPCRQEPSSIIDIDDLLDDESSTTSLPKPKPAICAPSKKAEKIVKHQAHKQKPVHENGSSDACSMFFPSSSSSSRDKAANFALTVNDQTKELQCESSKQSPITKLSIKPWEQVTGEVKEPEKEEKIVTESFTLAGTEKTKKPNQTVRKKKEKKPIRDSTQTENQKTEEPIGTRKKKKPVRDSFTQTENQKTEEPKGTRKKKKTVKDAFTQTEERTGRWKKIKKWWNRLFRRLTCVY